MGITSELVRIAFSKNRSFETNVTRNQRKRSWGSVRSYLCGDDLINSVFEQDYCSTSARTSKATVFSSRIDDDSGSVNDSEATVTQPVSENTKLTSENEVAVVIQSAFRSFMARARREHVDVGYVDVGYVDVESMGTSVEVQTGNSVMEVKDGGQSFTNISNSRTNHHKSARVQPLKQKEGWDDSTVSSNISKMRIQNRLEASTRRERALAYAFSQQLRICSKKKPSARSGNTKEANMGWSWLERWMATRQHDDTSFFGDISKQFEQLNVNQKLMVKNKVISGDHDQEKESCGSNDVSLHFDDHNVSFSSKTTEKSYGKPVIRNWVKGTAVSKERKLPH